MVMKTVANDIDSLTEALMQASMSDNTEQSAFGMIMLNFYPGFIEDFERQRKIIKLKAEDETDAAGMLLQLIASILATLLTNFLNNYVKKDCADQVLEMLIGRIKTMAEEGNKDGNPKGGH